MIHEEKKAAHPMMIMLVTWVCVSMWGFPCTSISVISSDTHTRVAIVNLNIVTVSSEHLLENNDNYPKFKVRFIRK